MDSEDILFHDSDVFSFIDLPRDSMQENEKDSMSIKAVCVPIKFNRLGEMEKR